MMLMGRLIISASQQPSPDGRRSITARHSLYAMHADWPPPRARRLRRLPLGHMMRLLRIGWANAHGRQPALAERFALPPCRRAAGRISPNEGAAISATARSTSRRMGLASGKCHFHAS